MKAKILLLIFIFSSVLAFAQRRPDQFTEETSPTNANFEVYSQKNGQVRRASLLNLKKYFTPEVETTAINYVPASTGNTTNLMEFVKTTGDSIYFIDAVGSSFLLYDPAIGSGSTELSDGATILGDGSSGDEFRTNYNNPNGSTTNDIIGTNSRGEGIQIKIHADDSYAQGYQDTIYSDKTHASGNQLYSDSLGFGRFLEGINNRIIGEGNHQRVSGVGNRISGLLTNTEGSVIDGGYESKIFNAYQAGIYNCKNCILGDSTGALQGLANYSIVGYGDRLETRGQSFLSLNLGGRDNIHEGDVLSIYAGLLGGRYNRSRGLASYSLNIGGRGGVSSGQFASVTAGDSLQTWGVGEVARGLYNVTNFSANQANIMGDNFLYTLGNGVINQRSNAITVLGKGWMQINSKGFGVGLTKSDVTPKGILDLESTTGAFIPPRMTTTQRNALPIVEGSIVVDITLDSIFYYLGGSWNAIGSASGTSSNVLSFSNPNLSIDGGTNNVDISEINHWTKEGDGDLTYSDNTKQVGIGTNNPSHTLDIQDNGNAEINLQRVAGAALRFQSQSARGVFGTFSNHPFDIVTNSTLRMRVLTNGFVSTAAFNPAVELHAGDAFANAASFIISNSATGHTSIDGTRITTNVLNSSIKNQENGTFDIWTNGIQQIQLKADGNLDLGSSVTSNNTTILNKFKLNNYGSGTNTGTVAKYLAVEADGDVIETDLSNIYSADGTLTGNRTVTLGTNSVTFQGIDGSNVNSSSFENDVNNFSITDGTNTSTLTQRADEIKIGTAPLKIVNDALDQIIITDNETNSTTKNGGVGLMHYTNTEEPVSYFYAQSGAAFSNLRIGGGSSDGNAATSIRFYTAANNTTTVGTNRMEIQDDGDIVIFSELVIDDTNNVRLLSGSGTPEGNVTAGVGSTYSRTDGGASTSFYVKESGTGNTGWVAK